MTCTFCYRHCNIQSENQLGFCQQRKLHNNQIVSLNYGNLVSLALDPIEKKPLYHFLPGSISLSLAEPGCNYRCAFCQNYTISQSEYHPYTEHVEPEQIINLAKRKHARSISYTYSEPSIWQDYLIDTATQAKEANIKNVMVTNGSFSEESRKDLFEVVDAFNVDVKGDDTFYQKVCQARIQPVLDNIEAIVQAGLHLEVTTLLIEGIHTEQTIRFLGNELSNRGVQVWHLSRFFPRYQMEDREPTSEAFLEEMLNIAKESGIPYIYGGNSVHQDRTFCPHCGSLLISDHQYGGGQQEEVKRNMPHGFCAHCGQKIYGIFS